MKKLLLLPILGAFAVTGSFTGWLVGAGGGTLGSTLIPLAVGLLGAVSYQLVEKKFRGHEISKRIKKIESDTTKSAVESVLTDLKDDDLRAPALWALGVIVFCVASYFGVQYGISSRNPAHIKLGANVNDWTKLPSEDKLLLYRLYWGMLNSGVPNDEAQQLFGDVFGSGTMTTATRGEAEKLLSMMVMKEFNRSPMGSSKAYLHNLPQEEIDEIVQRKEQGTLDPDKAFERLLKLIDKQ